MWPQIRAALVALHVIVITLLALPAPEGGMDRNAWKNPTVQGELRAWTDSLNACGIDITQPELEDRLWHAANAYMNARGTVLGPLSPYCEYCGTDQSWRMFVAPHRYPTTLHIAIAEGGAWRPAYVERDPRYTWLARQLDSYRFRSVAFRLGWPGYEGEFDRLAHWVARRAANDFPDAGRVRVSLVKSRTRSPEEVRAGAATETEVVLSVELPPGARP
jgi:hypothetical protein